MPALFTLEYLIERARPYQDTSILVYVDEKSEGIFSDDHRIHKISEDILTKFREDPKIKLQREVSANLLDECTELMRILTREIVLQHKKGGRCGR